MPCYKPIRAWECLSRRDENGKKIIRFDDCHSSSDPNWDEVFFPCGKCVGCHFARSKSWALRCVHESQQYPDNMFITLTFSPEFLDPQGSLRVHDFQLFMKRFRKKYQGAAAVDRCGKITFPIRYFHCGEYGEERGRPHHHACIFNFDFPDQSSECPDGKVVWKYGEDGHPIYTCKMLDDLWSIDGKRIGIATIGEVTFESAAYVARYVTKKLYGLEADKYEGKHPEYITMSRRPGIGYDWLRSNWSDMYPKDYTTVNGFKFPAPKYYDKIFEKEYPREFVKVKDKRMLAMYSQAREYTPNRLRQREAVAMSKMKKLVRRFENEG